MIILVTPSAVKKLEISQFHVQFSCDCVTVADHYKWHEFQQSISASMGIFPEPSFVLMDGLSKSPS